MLYSAEIIQDFIGALAVLALLAATYGALTRRLAGPHASPSILGILFGLCACLQMAMPFSPVEGLIIDMRNVPIVLAGAFLGKRGLALCLIIAASFRFGIGGVGWIAGVLGMCLAGLAGFAWHHLTHKIEQRGARHFFLLAVMGNMHLAAVFVLPANLAVWFITNAAPLLIMLNLISIPIVSWLLELEKRRLRDEVQMRRAARTEPKSGLLLNEAFIDDLRNIHTANDGDPARGLAVVSLRHRSWLQSFWGDDAPSMIRGALRKRLEGIVTHGGSLGMDKSGKILIPLTARELVTPGTITTLHRAVQAQSFRLDGNVTARVTADVGLVAMPQAPEHGADLVTLINEALREATYPDDTTSKPAATAVPTVRKAKATAYPAPSNRLFAQFDLEMSLSKT